MNDEKIFNSAAPTWIIVGRSSNIINGQSALSLALQKESINHKSYYTINEAIDFLILEKDNLKKYNIISSIAFIGQNSIYIPNEWSGKANSAYESQSGAVAGFVFAKEFIASGESITNRVWNPLPAIAYVSALSSRIISSNNNLFGEYFNSVLRIWESSNSKDKIKHFSEVNLGKNYEPLIEFMKKHNKL